MIKPLHIFLIIAGFLVVMTIVIRLNPPMTKSNEDLYLTLREPLIATFLYEGKTLNTEEQGQFFIEYSFDGWMTGARYKISVARNIDFKDCAGCIGSPYAGMLTPPEYGDDFISLQEFIIQMVKANNENNENNDHNGEMLWHSKSGYIWEIISKENYTSISAWVNNGKRIYAYVEP